MLGENDQEEAETPRTKLLRFIKEIPSLDPKRLAASELCYPKLSRPGDEEAFIGLPDIDIEELWEEIESELDDDFRVRPKDHEDTEYPIERLFRGIRRAAEKSEFGKTTLERWHQTLIYSENNVKRLSSEKRFERIATTSTRYSDGIPINSSCSVANDWFTGTVIPEILDERVPKHSRAVVGGPGCGKSTIFKYLLSENAELIDRQNVVFSRFEFLKFWRRWRDQRETKERALEDYMSFIHSRDLFLHHFFTLVDGCRFEPRWQFNSAEFRDAELRKLELAMKKHAPQFGLADEGDLRMLVQETFAQAALSNANLIEWLAKRSTAERKLLIAALWQEDVHLVTIFDGLDSLRVEDAFKDSKEWEAVDHIIRNRRYLSAPTELLDLGWLIKTDSIVVMRNNTADAMEARYASKGEPLEFQKYFHLNNIHGLAAMVSIVTRAADLIPDVAKQSEKQKDVFVFNVMRVIQRTVLAIWRGHGPAVPSDLIYNFFDGNLRETFYFVARVMFWSVREMLKLGYLHDDEYFPAPTPKLVSALASTRGNDFLHRKSYRVVELLLFRKGEWFENQAFILDTDDPMMEDIGVTKRIVGNARFYGEIDNIFNYTNDAHIANLDRHCMLEKIRIVQLCSQGSLSFRELEAALNREFGFVVSDLKLLVRFLQKTDFLTSEVYRNPKIQFRYSATARGKLCVGSLINNLSYVEHVFHRTLIPKAIVELVDDLPRNENSLRWAAYSVRNAFILLAYFKALEMNPAKGVAASVQYRLFVKLQNNLMKSLVRMTRPGAGALGSLERKGQTQRDAAWICETAVEQIEAVMRDWGKKNLLQ